MVMMMVQLSIRLQTLKDTMATQEKEYRSVRDEYNTQIDTMTPGIKQFCDSITAMEEARIKMMKETILEVTKGMNKVATFMITQAKAVDDLVRQVRCGTMSM